MTAYWPSGLLYNPLHADACKHHLQLAALKTCGETLQEPYNVTIVSPPSVQVKYTTAVNAKLAGTSGAGAVLTVTAPDLALPQDATTTGNLTYIVTANAQVRAPPSQAVPQHGFWHIDGTCYQRRKA